MEGLEEGGWVRVCLKCGGGGWSGDWGDRN